MEQFFRKFVLFLFYNLKPANTKTLYALEFGTALPEEDAIWNFQPPGISQWSREFDQSKADVIHKYTTEEARNLQAYDELPANARINQTAIDMAMDGGGEQGELEFEFEDI